VSGAARALCASAASRGRRIATPALLVPRFVLWSATGLALGLALALALPLAFHARPLTVLSGSMEPALHVGDVAIAKRIAPLDARPSDIVTFRDPQRHGTLVTHRVRSVRAQGSKVVFVTRGDANNSSERWRIAADGQLSRTLYTIPKVGHAILFARTRTGVFVLLLIPVLLLGIWEIAAIWRQDDGDA
jgi:signal peptidase I